ncbi:hypothetical protein PUN28_018370 [Cardiocondyla obscurior]|uniref:Uncharacterized protein n=1 Tax=Cardiocondyla obscurior TaxID=286306 RepID=A0AAW2EL09_9HYME
MQCLVPPNFSTFFFFFLPRRLTVFAFPHSSFPDTFRADALSRGLSIARGPASFLLFSLPPHSLHGALSGPQQPPGLRRRGPKREGEGGGTSGTAQISINIVLFIIFYFMISASNYTPSICQYIECDIRNCTMFNRVFTSRDVYM